MADVGYLKQHYSSLATDELLRLRSTHLTDAALAVLQEELASRLEDVDAAEEGFLKDREARQVNESSLASIGARFLAKLVDYVGGIAALTAVAYLSFLYLPRPISDAIGDASIVALFVYLLFKDGFGGQSIGKRLLGIRVVQGSTGEPCTLPRSFIRNILGAFGVVDAAFALGIKRQRLGDLAAGTSVVWVDTSTHRRNHFQILAASKRPLPTRGGPC
jgi:uncharacterized RDD family membrane protein YckC